MDIPLRDLRMAVRALARKPGVTALAVASLGLAIGFSTAAFSILDAWSLRDLPVRKPRSLAWIYALTREQRPDDLSWVEYEALASRAHSFTAILAQDRRGPRVKLPDRDDFPITAGVSDNYFDLLGVTAVMGDVFHAGQGRDQTVVLSHRYWTQALASDPAIIGRSLAVGPGILKVIGVLPPGFTGANRGIAVDLFVPSQTFVGSIQMSTANAAWPEYELLGRLRPGVTPDQARSEANAILRQVDKDGRAPAPDRKAGVETFTQSSLAAKIESNAVLLGIVVLLLLIAGANLANLRLVDNERRRREDGIRLALGAGRGVLARQHFAETLLLSAAGTASGLLLAAWVVRAAPALLYAGQRFTDYNIRLDIRSFAFSSAALLLVAVIGTLIPWSDAWKRRLIPALQGSRTTGSSRWLTALVVSQMALVTGVTCSAGLLWRSLENVSAIRPAMDPDRRLLMVRGFWDDSHATDTRTQTLADRLSGLPGVERVAFARRALLSDSLGGATVGIEMSGQPKFQFRYNQISPNYLAATGARLLNGRPFGASDGPGAAPVVLVNSAFVRRFLSGREPLGTWVRVGGKDRQIVGIVEDGPTIHLREPLEPYLYFPFAQMPTNELTVFVESGKDPSLLADTVRSFIRGDTKAFTILDEITMRQHMRAARSDEQLASEVTGALAAVGLALAAAGLFGVSLFAVARRTPEFGVRVAMGATPSMLLRQVLREAGRRIAIAIPLGWALAFAGRHALQKLLYGVAPDDPWTFLLASILVGAVGCVAALHPAIRAARIDPMTALRHE
jgi:predicted permease